MARLHFWTYSYWRQSMYSLCEMLLCPLLTTISTAGSPLKCLVDNRSVNKGTNGELGLYYHSIGNSKSDDVLISKTQRPSLCNTLRLKDVVSPVLAAPV